jgi:S1-C subfamily serine protease
MLRSTLPNLCSTREWMENPARLAALLLALLLCGPAHGGDATTSARDKDAPVRGDAPAAVVRGEGVRPAAYTLPDLEALQRAFQSVTQDVAPSVVGLRSRRPRSLPTGFIAPQSGPGAVDLVVVNGSGTIISADGLILTNEHVVGGATEIDVLFSDGQKYPGTIVAADARSDLAIVKVRRSGLRPVHWAEWRDVARGQWSVVLGNPFGLGQDGQLSVSIGVVSNLGRQLPGLGEADDRFYYDMIQTTAPINPGDSGGPLFNVHGELIGVITAMHTRAPADEGIGFAIPMNATKRRLIDYLAQGNPIEYGYLGLTVRMPENDERESLGPQGGIFVQQVEAGGPAAQAGLRVGDVIRRFDEQAVTRPAQLAELVGQSPVGTKVSLDVLRNGRSRPTQVTVSRRELSRVNEMRGTAGAAAKSTRGANLTDDGDQHKADPDRSRAAPREILVAIV